MTLSVILPNYNHARFLPETLERLLEQSVPPAEILVIDDASTDHSADLVGQWARKDSRIQLFRNEQNRGPVFGMNRGLELAKGEWIFFSAADDVVLPTFFARSLDLLARYPQAGLCSALSRVMDEAGKDQGVYASPLIRRSEGFVAPGEALSVLRTYGPWFMGNTTIYRRDALRAAGFHPELRSFCDGFTCQVMAIRHGACFIPESLASWRKIDAGYAARDNADWQVRLEIRERAAQLMRTTYADTFPPAYVDFWERQSRYAAGRAAWGQVRAAQEEYLREKVLRLRPRTAWMDRLLLAGVSGLGRLQLLLVRLHLFLRFRGIAEWLRVKAERWRRAR